MFRAFVLLFVCLVGWFVCLRVVVLDVCAVCCCVVGWSVVSFECCVGRSLG